MSTHIRPRPAPPPSPVRPSTAHSTIRAITPSPTNSTQDLFHPRFSRPRPQSDQAFGSHERATLARYLELNNPSPAPPQALQRSGITSGRSSPAKSRSRSPKKQPFSTPEHFVTHTAPVPTATTPAAQASDSDEENISPPSTPTPIPASQKRHAYLPLGARNPATLPKINTRISVSGASNTTALSAASKHSVFSTPGRDELERKKALVEVDEGPFARATSMMDLDEERRRVSAGGGMKGVGGKKERWCGVGCVIM